jgi:lipid II:glycine glycyltransferase (peptidoglycan interpeptide bridge formation enzyme)
MHRAPTTGTDRSALAICLGGRVVFDCVTPLGHEEWNERLGAHPDASFFHSAAWAEVLQNTYSYRPVYVLQRDAENPILLPLMEVDSVLTGRRGISLPFTDQCEILGGDECTRGAVFRHIMVRATMRRWNYVEFRSRLSGFEEAKASTVFHGHSIPLDRESDRVFGRITGRARTAVRKAIHEGVKVEFASDAGAMRSFYNLLCESRKNHGAPPQPAGFFEYIYRDVIMADKGTLILAKKDNKTIAGAVFFHFGRVAIYKYAGAAKAFRHLQASSIVLWKAIEHYGQRGFAVMDLGRTSLYNAGLRQFKLAWNAAERRIEYFRYDLKENAFVAKADQFSSRSSRILKSLPPRVSQLVGAFAYKHFA